MAYATWEGLNSKYNVGGNYGYSSLKVDATGGDKQYIPNPGEVGTDNQYTPPPTATSSQNPQFPVLPQAQRPQDYTAPDILGGYNWVALDASYTQNRAQALEGQRRYEASLVERAPYIKTGQNALAKLEDLALGEPQKQIDTLRSLPGYQFTVAEGVKGLERSQAARHGLLSGRAMKEMEGYRQGLADLTYGNEFNRLSGMAYAPPPMGWQPGSQYGGRAEDFPSVLDIMDKWQARFPKSNTSRGTTRGTRGGTTPSPEPASEPAETRNPVVQPYTPQTLPASWKADSRLRPYSYDSHDVFYKKNKKYRPRTPLAAR